MNEAYLSKASHLLGSAKGLLHTECSLEPLLGDASTRHYFRVQSKRENISYILVATDPFQASKDNFLLVQKLFADRGLPVPEVLGVEEKEGLLLLSDLGDKTMLKYLKGSKEEELKLFQDAIRLMMDIHGIKKNASPDLPAFSLDFDRDFLMGEVDFTFRYFFKDYLKRDIDRGELSTMKDAFQDICSILAKGDKVLCHRDFHSRNLMINNDNKLFCIDFQDARMGIPQYDLCSLLRDSYYQLSEEKIESLLKFYIKECKDRYQKEIEEESFVRIFDLMSIQRNFKAIGSFASFYVRRNNSNYLCYIENTFENIKRNLNKFPEYQELNKLLLKCCAS